MRVYDVPVLAGSGSNRAFRSQPRSVGKPSAPLGLKEAPRSSG
ncbi:hypothetical protein SGRIM128S_07538 [Streptomyces griseomycini]